MTITIDKHTITVDSWNNLTPAQLYRFCAMVLGEVNPARLKVKLLLNFCGLKLIRKPVIVEEGIEYQWFRLKRKKILLSLVSIQSITESIIHIFYRAEESGNYIINSRLSRNLIQPFRTGYTKQYGPADALSNITFKEFIHTETAFSRYEETGDEQYFDRVIAILFRPRKNVFSRWFETYTGDIRQAFNDFEIEKRAEKIRKLDPATRLSIKYYYTGSRNLLQLLFPEVFVQGEPGGVKTDPFTSFMRVVDELANSNPAEKENIRNQPLYEVLDSLNNIAIKAKKHAT